MPNQGAVHSGQDMQGIGDVVEEGREAVVCEGAVAQRHNRRMGGGRQRGRWHDFDADVVPVAGVLARVTHRTAPQ